MKKYALISLIIISFSTNSIMLADATVKNNEYILADELPILVKTALFTIEFYQNHLGQIKGSYCPMYPSCSEYGKIAITKYGYVGILKTFDRLHRCSHDLENYEVIIFDDEVRYLDEPD